MAKSETTETQQFEAEQAEQAPEAKNEPTLWDMLAEPFNPSCIEWLPKVVRADEKTLNERGYGMGKGLALCYIDARSVMARLDEVVGPEGWQDSYRWEGNRTICRLAILVNGNWIAKEDGSGDSQVEAEKGGISGAFKRAAVKWGIGRYLYDVPEIWAECEVRAQRGNGKPKIFHNGWTDKGQAMLDEAINNPMGRRETGKPFSVTTMLAAIDAADQPDLLRKVYNDHWEGIPVEYRKEILANLDRRKEEIMREAKSQNQE